MLLDMIQTQVQNKLMEKIVSFLYESVIQKKIAQNFCAPTHPKTVPTALTHVGLCKPTVAFTPEATPGPTVIKLFGSENELKFKNRLHYLIETLRLNSNF